MTTEELISLAQNPIKKELDKNFLALSTTRQFIIAEGIKTGTYKVPAAVIYKRYVDWCHVRGVEPKTVVYFFKDFKTTFKTVKLNTSLAYLVDPAGFNLSLTYFNL